jgi:hypothetical protein
MIDNRPRNFFLGGLTFGFVLMGMVAVYAAREGDKAATLGVEAATKGLESAEKLLECRQERAANLDTSTILFTKPARSSSSAPAIALQFLVAYVTHRPPHVALDAADLRGVVYMQGKTTPAVPLESGEQMDYFWCSDLPAQTGDKSGSATGTRHCQGPFRAKVF